MRKRKQAMMYGTAALMGGLLTASLVTIVHLAASDPAPQSPNASEVVNGAIPRGLLVPPGTPCPTAVHASMDELKSGERPKLFQTDATLPDAKVATPTDAWTCGDAPSVPVVIFDGVQVAYEPGWEDVDADAKFQEMVKQRGGVVEMIAGMPAFVNDGNAEEQTKSTVSVITPDGIMLNLDAIDDRPAKELVPIATSIVENRTTR